MQDDGSSSNVIPMIQAALSEEIKSLITGGSANENAAAFVRLAQDWVANLRKLQTGDKDAVTFLSKVKDP